MLRFLLRRLAHALLLLAGVSVLSFLLSQAAPGDFTTEARLDPQLSRQTLQAYEQRFGTGRPIVLRYLSWVRGTLSGDMGTSFASNMPVASLLIGRAANTLLLTGTAAGLAWTAALIVGIWAGARARSRLGLVAHFGLSLLLAVPPLLLALGGLMLAVQTGWFPAGGIRSLDDPTGSRVAALMDLGRHMFLPVVVLALGYLPFLAIHVRSAVAGALEAPYIEHLRALGVPRRTLLFRYVLKAASNPLITLLGFSIGTLLSGSAVVEIVFGWPGVGPLLLEAILARDLFVVVNAVMLSAVLLVAGNVIADLLLFAVDPRIRAR